MKITMVVTEFGNYQVGGLGRFANYYCDYLRAKGHELTVIAWNFNDAFPAYEKQSGIEIYRPKTPLFNAIYKKYKGLGLCKIFDIGPLLFLLFNLKAYKIVAQQKRQGKLDIVSVHDWLSALVGILTKNFLRAPVVFHVHSTEITMTNWDKSCHSPFKVKLLRYLENTMAKKADSIIVASDQMKQLLTSHSWPVQKIKIIHYMIKPELTNNVTLLEQPEKEAYFQKLFPDLDIADNIIVYAGRIINSKGIFQLLDGFKNLDQGMLPSRLVLIGTGEQSSKLREAINSLNLDSRVYFYDRFLSFNEVLNHFNLADLCVFPSNYEPFGLVAIEAMSLAKPVILGKGYSSFFHHFNDTAISFPLSDNSPAVITDVLAKVLGNKAKAKQVGQNAQRFLDSFKNDSAINEIVENYTSVIA